MVSSQDLTITGERALALREKYPNKYPVVIKELGDGLELEKRKYLVADTTTVGQLQFAVRKYMKVEPHEAIFMYVNSTIHPTQKLVRDIWRTEHEDNCLYIKVFKENTFGNL